MMQQSSRRPPSYPPPAYPAAATAAPRATPQPTPKRAAVSRPAAPPAPPPAPAPAPAPAYAARAQRDVVVRSLGLKLLAVIGILHASLLLVTLVVLVVMAVGGDARVALVMRTIKTASTGLWTWTLFAIFTSFVLGFVMLYNAIGALSLTPWTQRATKLWSAVWLVLSAVAVIVNLGWIYPLLRDAAPDRFTFARTLIVTWLHIAAGIVWPAIVLFYMNSRHVKQAYDRVAGGASAM